jgi:hypothetical protein
MNILSRPLGSLIRPVETWLWVVSVTGMILWSTWPSLLALTGTLTCPTVPKQLVEQGTDRVHLDLQRGIQRHFLKYGVYIPVEDIFFASDIQRRNADLAAAIGKACGGTGSAAVAVWVPLMIRFPYFGERSIEWCWKPSLTE